MSLTEQIRQMKVDDKLMLSELVNHEEAKDRKYKATRNLHPLFNRVEGKFKTNSQLTYVGDDLWLLVVVTRSA